MKQTFLIHLILFLIAVFALLAGIFLMAGCENKASPKEAVLQFHSYDGGGPEYDFSVADPGIVSFRIEKEYNKLNHKELTGAGYTVSCVLTGLSEGETVLKVSENGSLSGNSQTVYRITVDKELSVTAEKESAQAETSAVSPIPQMIIKAGDAAFYAAPESNSAAKAFTEKLSTEELTVELHENGGFEKRGSLPWTLPYSGESAAAQAGDLILCGKNRIALCYDSQTAEFIRLAQIGADKKDELIKALGDSSVTVTMWVEWSE